MKSHHLIRLGDDFFNSMPKLKVLYSCDYSPESHCHPQLEDMRCLHLWGANLISLPKEAMQLQKLEQLTLRTPKPTVDIFTLTLKGLVEQFFRLRVLIFSTVCYDYECVGRLGNRHQRSEMASRYREPPYLPQTRSYVRRLVMNLKTVRVCIIPGTRTMCRYEALRSSL